MAGLGFERDSWVAPAGVRRVRPEEDANDVAVAQACELVGRLPVENVAPLFDFDAGHDLVRLRIGPGEPFTPLGVKSEA